MIFGIIMIDMIRGETPKDSFGGGLWYARELSKGAKKNHGSRQLSSAPLL